MNLGTVYYLNGSPRRFRPAPRFWRGNMCGVRVADLPDIPGGAADASLVLSWFYDRYDARDRARIRATWRARRYTHVLLSWPDSRAFGASPAAFADTCAELIDDGFYPCPMLYSKDHDPDDTAGILTNIAPVMPHLIGLVPLACIGFELSIELSPTTVQELIDTLAPPLVEAGCRVYVHFQQGYGSFQQPSTPTEKYYFKDFWNLNVGKLTGLLHQKVLTHPPEAYRYASGGLVDILIRFAGNAGCAPDSGFGHPFDCIALEIDATQQFAGEHSEAIGDVWGRWATDTPAQGGPGGLVHVMGSGNGRADYPENTGID